MRQHRALRREYGFLACREEAPSSGFAARKRLRVPHELLSRGWTLCLVLLVTGSLCLVADAGRPERVISLWLSPRFTVMTVGAWALLGFERVGGFLSLCRMVLVRAIAAVVVAAGRRGDSRSCHGDLHWGASHAASLGYRFWDMACSGTLLSFVVVVRGGRSLRHRIFLLIPACRSTRRCDA